MDGLIHAADLYPTLAALAGALVAERGAIQVNSPTELRRAMTNLLANPDEREEIVQNARKVLDTHRGATGRAAQLLALRSDLRIV